MINSCRSQRISQVGGVMLETMVDGLKTLLLDFRTSYSGVRPKNLLSSDSVELKTVGFMNACVSALLMSKLEVHE